MDGMRDSGKLGPAQHTPVRPHYSSHQTVLWGGHLSDEAWETGKSLTHFPSPVGPMCDLLWSDPQPQVSWVSGCRFGLRWGRARPSFTQSLLLSCSYQNGRSVSKRGVSCQFGPDVTKAFLEENQLDYIIRSHEVKAEGYEVAHGGRCVTVFSAPNYWCVYPSHSLPKPQGLFCVDYVCEF